MGVEISDVQIPVSLEPIGNDPTEGPAKGKIEGTAESDRA